MPSLGISIERLHDGRKIGGIVRQPSYRRKGEAAERRPAASPGKMLGSGMYVGEMKFYSYLSSKARVEGAGVIERRLR